MPRTSLTFITQEYWQSQLVIFLKLLPCAVFRILTGSEVLFRSGKVQDEGKNNT